MGRFICMVFWIRVPDLWTTIAALSEGILCWISMQPLNLLRMKKIISLLIFSAIVQQTHAQYFNEEVNRLCEAAVLQYDPIALNQVRSEIMATDIQTARFNLLPRFSLISSFTHLNDDLVFPQNLQSLLYGTQKLLIKEAIGLPFNTSLPASVPLQPVTPIQQQNIWKASVQSQWLLFSGLRVRYTVRALQQQQKSIGYLNRKQQSRLYLEVSELYDRLALLQESESILETTDALLQQQMRGVQTAVETGLATPIDRKKVELALQKLNVKRAENRIRKSALIDKMQQLTHQPETILQQLHPQLIPAAFDSSSARKDSPEIQALRAGIAARNLKEQAELAAYIPTVAAFGQYELRKQDLSILDPQWAVGVKVSWNLFDGLTARNNARKERLERRALEIQQQSARDWLTLGFAKAKLDYELATEKHTLRFQEIQMAQELLGFAQKQYQNGLVSITEVLSAVNDLEKARFEYSQSLFEQRRAALEAADIRGTLISE